MEQLILLISTVLIDDGLLLLAPAVHQLEPAFRLHKIPTKLKSPLGLGLCCPAEQEGAHFALGIFESIDIMEIAGDGNIQPTLRWEFRQRFSAFVAGEKSAIE